MNRINIHKQVIDHYGWVAQVEKFIEEMGELTEALEGYLKIKSEAGKIMIIEEFADVLNMIEQFEIIAKEKELFTHLDVDKEQNRKMQMTLERMHNGE